MTSTKLLHRVWGRRTERDALNIVLELAAVGLGELVLGDGDSPVRLRLHYLVHDFAMLCAQ